MIRCLAVSVVVFLAAVLVSAQGGHTIRGKVRSADGSGIPHVLVSLESGNGAPIGQATTNNEGDFYFSGLTENSYTVNASVPDHQPASQQVRFIKIVAPTDPGETQLVEITLRSIRKDSQFSIYPVFAQDIPPAAKTKFDEATRSLKNKDSKKAIATMREALAILPDYFDARLALASELMKTGEFNEAIVELEKARKVNPRDFRLYQMFGMILSEKRMPDRAAEVLAEAIKLKPNDPQLLYLRATALIDSVPLIDIAKADATAQKAQRLQDAEKALSSAFDLSGKKLFLVHLQMARVYEKSDQPKRAADELEKYLASSPNDKNASAIREAIKKLRDKS